MALIRSKRNLCAQSTPMATWITVSLLPPPPASCGLLTPPTLLTCQSSLGRDSAEPRAGDRRGPLPFTVGETYQRPAACTGGVTCSATTSTPHFPYASLRHLLVSNRRRVRLSAKSTAIDFSKRCAAIPS